MVNNIRGGSCADHNNNNDNNYNDYDEIKNKN
jgi:hypothetical protein